MIAYPIDPALIRDHIFHDTGDLNIVLNPDTFYRPGAFKRVKDYGLGYFNYQFQIQEEIYTPSVTDTWRSEIYDNFVKYLVIVLIVMSLWSCYFILDWDRAISLLARLPVVNIFVRKYYRSGRSYNHYNDELEYHYIKS
ncbi:hypothetical protein MOUN0_M01618 [Monosporozyma unispora]|nr:hypothetical protein C6P44_002683 [Kazachstania unispora]